MKKLLRIVAYIIFVFLIYVLVNDPFWVPTFGILGRASRQHGVVLLMVLSVIYIIKYFTAFSQFLKMFRSEFLLMYILIMYGVVIGRSVTGISMGTHLEMLFQTILIPFCLIYFSNKKLRINDENGFVKTILIMSAIGGILTAICILNPSFDAYVKDSILQLSEEDKLTVYTYRAFGVARGLLYGYGIAQGIAMSLGILYLSKNKWYLFALPLVFISIVFNARTGLLMPVIATCIYFYTSGKRVTTVFVAILLVLFLLNSRDFIALFGNEKSSEWIGNFFDQMIDITQSGDIEESSTLTHLFRSNILPTTFDGWVIGTGIDIARLSTNNQSDIGFMRQVHYGGIIYCTILYWLLLYMSRRLWFYRYKSLAVFFFFTFLISNLKGLYVPLSNGYILYALVYYYLIYNKKMAVKVEKQTKYNKMISGQI